MKLSLRKIQHPRGPRCGYCHENSEMFSQLVPCVACGATIHRVCRAELGRCPTLGCREFKPEEAGRPGRCGRCRNAVSESSLRCACGLGFHLGCRAALDRCPGCRAELAPVSAGLPKRRRPAPRCWLCQARCEAGLLGCPSCQSFMTLGLVLLLLLASFMMVVVPG